MAITELKSLIDCLPFFKHNWKFTLLEQWPSIIGTLNNKVNKEKSSSSILPFSKKESAALINIQDDELRHFLTLFRNHCLSGAD
ncbi:hypothetical protein EKK58_01790 [Candidatus Dependentiae bacterium]|nr:MAG: hypothetical protein EKK58_01790 [Candidatus Dependentiae bacterium]